MRILMLGAGAVGGYYGARLVQAGADVTFLVRERRARQLRADGLVVRSEAETMRLASPRVITVPEGAYDIVFLSCKAYDLAAALDAVTPAVGEASLVVPLVNGVAQFDALDARFGAARIAGGSCHLSGALEDDGTVKLYAPIHRIVYGARRGNRPGAAARLGELHAFFSRTPVPAVLSGDIMQELWDKYVMLCALAAMTCLMRASVGDIMRTERGRTYALAVLDSCIRVADHAGYRPSPDVIRGSEDWITAPGSTFMASMLRDVERGRPTEADHIVGDMVRRARAAGIDAPLLEVAHCHLQAYEARRRREAGRAAGAAP